MNPWIVIAGIFLVAVIVCVATAYAETGEYRP